MIFKEMTINELLKIQNHLSDFDDFWTPKVFEEELKNTNSHYLIAIEQDEIIGFGGISIVLDEASLNNIAVRFDKRNKKIGSKILAELISLAKAHNCSTLSLEVRIDNVPAIKLYKKFGFTEIRIRKKYYNNTTDGIVMNLKID